MECRKERLERKYSKEFTALFGAWIPCPVHGVIHTPEGDKPINIKEEKTNERIS
jgi:hypothetical protein